MKDFGAGSSLTPYSRRSIADIAKHSAKSSKYGQLLFRLVNYWNPHNMLELGTSLGISAMYQALAKPTAKFITMEGCPNTAAAAKKNFEALHLNHIKQVVGDFSETLPHVLAQIDKLDYVFIDGNHKQAPTVAYFEACLAKSYDGTLFVFDDIHWSEEMERAWEYIKNHPSVTVTIDMFFLGLVFLRSGQVKQHFTLRF